MIIPAHIYLKNLLADIKALKTFSPNVNFYTSNFMNSQLHIVNRQFLKNSIHFVLVISIS